MARHFRRWACALLGGLLLAGHVCAMDVAVDGRSVLPLSDGWHFRYTRTSGDAKAMTATTLDDSSWQKISLPHTWNHFGEYRLTRSADIDSEQGVGWYRLKLAGSSIPARQRHYLQFDGVGNVADVWVNAVHVG
ncbi:MAG: sugar-binding domain-containing protein, partial [Rhodanobacter sp.]